MPESTNDERALLQSCVDSEIKTVARGYTSELEWQEKMSKGYTQHKCTRCGKYHIWKRKDSK